MTAESSKNERPERYNARVAEPRWQKAWDEQGIFATANDDPKPKYYVLEMFPYPSGPHPHGARAQLRHGRRGRPL